MNERPAVNRLREAMRNANIDDWRKRSNRPSPWRLPTEPAAARGRMISASVISTRHWPTPSSRSPCTAQAGAAHLHAPMARSCA